MNNISLLLRFGIGLTLAVTTGCAASTESDDASGKDSVGSVSQAATVGTATLTGCKEVIGTVSVDAAKARALVPAQYTLVLDTSGHAELVTQTNECAVGTVGDHSQPTNNTNVGITIVSPDGVPGFNLYTLQYLSSNPHYRNLLQSAGGDTKHVVDIDTTESGAQVTAHVGRPYDSTFDVTATVGTVSFASPVLARWWQNNGNTQVKLNLQFPSVTFTACTGTIALEAGSPLASLVGATSAPIHTCYYNDIAQSNVTVSN